MRRANLIAAQTRRQQELLQRNYRLDSKLVNMVAEPAQLPGPGSQDIDVLWVGSFRPVKRPEALVELAGLLPELRFALAGGYAADMESYFNRVTAAAKSRPNLTVYGAVPYQQVGALFDRAKVLVNTSTLEGFPNTFLQAWMRGIPVVSTFDPDGIIVRERLGAAAATPAELAPAIATQVSNEASRQAAAERIRAFALREFSAPAIAQKYLELLPV